MEVGMNMPSDAAGEQAAQPAQEQQAQQAQQEQQEQQEQQAQPEQQPAQPEQPASAPILPTQSREDTDVGWGDYADHDDDRLLRDRPPHWDNA
jgi:hypothetical protein